MNKKEIKENEGEKIMKFKKNIILSTSILSIIAHMGTVVAQDQPSTWQARSVENVLEDLTLDEDNQVTYIVKEGDTLSVIAEAMNIDLHYLANLNGIHNVDLILPGTTLLAQFNAENQATNLIVDTPEGDQHQIDLPVNLMPVTEIETESNQTSVVDEVESSPVIETSEEIQESPSIQLDEATEAIVEPVAEWVEEEVVTEAAETEVLFIEESVVEAAMDQAPPVEEPVTEAPIVDQPVLEEPVTEAPIEEELPAEVEEVIAEDAEIQPEDIEIQDPAEAEELVSEPESPEFDPMANPKNAGLQPHVAAYKEEVANKFGIDSFSLYRPGDSGDHGQGLAVDFMVPIGSQLGTDVANYSIANMADKGISYVIWEQAIYGDWNQTWTPMEDRGSDTANHYDHVHVSFN